MSETDTFLEQENRQEGRGSRGPLFAEDLRWPEAPGGNDESPVFDFVSSEWSAKQKAEFRRVEAARRLERWTRVRRRKAIWSAVRLAVRWGSTAVVGVGAVLMFVGIFIAVYQVLQSDIAAIPRPPGSNAVSLEATLRVFADRLARWVFSLLPVIFILAMARKVLRGR